MKSRLLPALKNIGIAEERHYFLESLSLLLEAGMDILSALSAIESEMRTKRMKQVIAEVSEAIAAGSAIWRALETTGVMPSQVISLIRIGEEAGRLSENLRVITLQQAKDRLFRSKIRSAMMYPGLVLSVSLLVGMVISWFILPRLASVFDQLHIDLPLVTRVLIGFGNLMGDFGYLILPAAIVCLGLFFYFAFFFGKTRHVGQGMLFLIPGIRTLIREAELGRASYVMGTLLQAGLPIVQTLESLRESTQLVRFQKLYAYLRDHIEEGDDFAFCFSHYPRIYRLIPVPIAQMIMAAEQSGNVPETFLKIGETFENRTETTMKNVTVILEPILLVIVWLGVVFVALAVILPIYSLIGGFQSGI